MQRVYDSLRTGKGYSAGSVWDILPVEYANGATLPG